MKDEESIERCKELIKESHSCWIGITNQIAIETVLNLIEKQKAEIEKLNFYLSASEQEHNHDIKMIDEVKGKAVKLYKEIEKKDKIIDLMAEDKYEYIDMLQMAKIGKEINYDPTKLFNGISDEEAVKIIKQYFENKVKESK